MIQQFLQPQAPGVERVACDALGNPACEGKSEGGHLVFPVLLIHAEGPSFEIAESLVSIAPASSSLGCSNMAAYISVGLEVGTQEIVAEVTRYAKYVPSRLLQMASLNDRP